MLLHDLRAQFNRTIPASDGFLKLMQNTFHFYTSLCHEFFDNLGAQIETNSLEQFLQTKIRAKLFDPSFCQTIGDIKKQFLAEIIRLEQFMQEEKSEINLLNDLQTLKKVSDAIYDLLENHWDLYKYEDSHVNSRSLVSFILEIDRIGIGWDSYLEKYLAVSKLLKNAESEKPEEGREFVSVYYHLPDETKVNLEMVTNFSQFLQIAFDFVVKAHKQNPKEVDLELYSLEIRNPVSCVVSLPNGLAGSFEKLLNYLSVDIIKRETLIKYVMEVVRLQSGEDMPKATVGTFHKNLVKQLKQLPEEGFLSVNYNASKDSVELLSSLCDEMDELDIRYKELLTGSTTLLIRNKREEKEKVGQTAGKAVPNSQKPLTKVPAPPGKMEKVVPVKTLPPTKESTVKINIRQKEHINFLTS